MAEIESESSMYRISAKGYPGVRIYRNRELIAFAEVFNGYSAPAVATVLIPLKEGDRITHTGDSMEMSKM